MTVPREVTPCVASWFLGR